MITQANCVKTLRSILALVLFLVAFPGAPTLTWASSNHVERRRPPAQLTSPLVSADLETAAPFAPQAPSHDAMTTPVSPTLANYTTVSLVVERRTPNRTPNLGESDRCRGP